VNPSTSDFPVYRLVFYSLFILFSLLSPMGHRLFGALDSTITLVSLALSIILLIYYLTRRTPYPALMLLVSGGFFCEMWLLTYFGPIIALLLILVAADLIWHSNLLQNLKLTPPAASFSRPTTRLAPTSNEENSVLTSVVGPTETTLDFAPGSLVEAEIPAVEPGQIAYRERGFTKVFSPAIAEQLLVGRGPEAQIWVAVAEVALRQLLITRQESGWQIENLEVNPSVQIGTVADESLIPLEVGIKQVAGARLGLGNAVLVLG
jgi:hypothetical protein